MNKIQKLLTVSALAASIAACSSGGSSNGGQAPITATKIDLSKLPGHPFANSASVYYSSQSVVDNFYFLGSLSGLNSNALNAAGNGTSYSTLPNILVAGTPLSVTYDQPEARYTFTSEFESDSQTYLQVALVSDIHAIPESSNFEATWKDNVIDTTDIEYFSHTAFYSFGESTVFGATGQILNRNEVLNDLYIVPVVESRESSEATLISTNFVENCAESNEDYITSLATITNLHGESQTNSYVGVGSHQGAVCIYSLAAESGSHWLSLSDIAKSKGVYSESSPVAGIQFVDAANNLRYGYWANENGKIWRVIANHNNQPITGSSNKAFLELTSLPNSPTHVVAHTLLVTRGNDVIVGGAAPQPKGFTQVYVFRNGVWQAVTLGTDTSAVKAISVTPHGVPVVATESGAYYLNNTNN